MRNMRKIKRAVRDGRRLQRTATAATRVALRGVALAQATGDVVAKRTALGLTAMANPAEAAAESRRIVPEKMAAFGASATTLMRCSGEIAEKAMRFAASEIVNATAAASDLARCRNLAAAIAVQGRFGTAWLFRAFSHSIAVGAIATRSYGDVMSPVHRVVVRNSKRLA
jgi:hypothetical protein